MSPTRVIGLHKGMNPLVINYYYYMARTCSLWLSFCATQPSLDGLIDIIAANFISPEHLLFRRSEGTPSRPVTASRAGFTGFTRIPPTGREVQGSAAQSNYLQASAR